MLRSSLLTVGACALAVSAAAQTSTTTPQVNRDIHRVQGQVKHAGVYHVATGTWTRVRGNQANLGPDIIYNNSIATGYYFGGMTNGGLVGLDWLGSGNIPTALSGGSFATQPNRTRYTVNGFEFAYCDTNTGTAGWEFTFYDNATPCQDVTSAPVATFTMPGLPNGGCWTVSFDLDATNPPTPFCLEGDGGAAAPGWDGDDPTLDNFGFNIKYLGLGTASCGVLLSGDPENDELTAGYVNPNIPLNCNPANCPAAPIPFGGHATYFNPAGDCAAVNAASIAANAATGRMTRDFWLATDNDPNTSGAPEGCYYFGGYFNPMGCNTSQNNPYAAAYMIIAASALECGGGTGGPINGGVQYCTSNPNSTTAVTALGIQGNRLPSLNDCVLTATSMPLNSFGYFITSQTAGLVMNPAGSQGNLCLAQNIGRFTGPGQIKNSGATGSISLSTLTNEWTLSAIPTATGPYPAAAGIRTHFQLWHRDSLLGNATSNFSNGHYVDWL
jgi:hypothetical protein